MKLMKYCIMFLFFQVDKEKGIEKRAVDTSSEIAYKKIIAQLLNDNKVLQQKLNETLQVLQRCVYMDLSNCQKVCLKKTCQCLYNRTNKHHSS